MCEQGRFGLLLTPVSGMYFRTALLVRADAIRKLCAAG